MWLIRAAAPDIYLFLITQTKSVYVWMWQCYKYISYSRMMILTYKRQTIRISTHLLWRQVMIKMMQLKWENINSQFCSVGKDLTVIAYDNLLLHECLCVLWWCTAIPHAVRIDVHVSYVSTNNGWFGGRAPAVQEMTASWKPTRSSVQNWMVITPHSQIKERLNPLR